MTAAITNMCNTFSLIDPWRVNNPKKKQFTWLQGQSKKQARLDYFLCNDKLLSISKNFKINPKYRSDHAPISCTIDLGEDARGPGTWKMNNALLKDANFIASIKKEINIFKSIYAATPYNPNNIDSVSHGFKLMIPPSLFWESLLATLRGTIIRYSKRKKKQREIDMQQLKNNIEILDEKVTTGTASQNKFDTLATLNNNLIELRSEILKGAYIRSRADWLEFGEKT